jgi:hypothetical protein
MLQGCEEYAAQASILQGSVSLLVCCDQRAAAAEGVTVPVKVMAVLQPTLAQLRTMCFY